MKEMRPAKGAFLAAVILGAFALPASWLRACDMPVFRYALERWTPDPFALVGVCDQSADPGIKALASRLGTNEFAAAYAVDRPDSDLLPQELAALMKAEKQVASPSVSLFHFSYGEGGKIAWSGALTAANVEALAAAPARMDIARRILSGDCIVWVVLDGTNETANLQAVSILTNTLAVVEREAQLPVLDQDPALADVPLSPSVPYKLAFSVVRIEHGSVEADIIKGLLGTIGFRDEAGLAVVVPVFGRGRALDGIPGAALNEDVVFQACGFLLGACSCEVKAMNPGVDLFIPVDWSAYLTGSAAISAELTVPTVQAQPAVEKTPEDLPPSEPKKPAMGLAVGMGAGAVILVAAVAIGTVSLFLRRNNRDQ
jgi:hypothetical protein